MAKKKQSLQSIQETYSNKLEEVKLRANEENVILRERLELAKVKISKLEAQLEAQSKV